MREYYTETYMKEENVLNLHGVREEEIVKPEHSPSENKGAHIYP